MYKKNGTAHGIPRKVRRYRRRLVNDRMERYVRWLLRGGYGQNGWPGKSSEADFDQYLSRSGNIYLLTEVRLTGSTAANDEYFDELRADAGDSYRLGLENRDIPSLDADEAMELVDKIMTVLPDNIKRVLLADIMGRNEKERLEIAQVNSHRTYLRRRDEANQKFLHYYSLLTAANDALYDVEEDVE